MTLRNGISVCLYTRPETLAEIRWSPARAGLVVAELEFLFTFRAQQKNATGLFLVEEVLSRETKKNTVEQSVHPKPRIAKTKDETAALKSSRTKEKTELQK